MIFLSPLVSSGTAFSRKKTLVNRTEKKLSVTYLYTVPILPLPIASIKKRSSNGISHSFIVDAN